MDATSAARSPLDASTLRSAAGSPWEVTLLPSVDSTNRYAADSPRAGHVVVAEHQVAGRGRLDRTWEAPLGAALTFSAVVQPHLELRHWPLIPLAAGLAVAQGLRAVGVEPALKWPNDVLLGGNKVAGILVERVGDPACAVVGIGINVDLQPEELPVPTATSLAIAGARTSRAEVFGAVLAALDHHMTTLQHSPETTLAHYRTACDTLGREVEAHLPGEIRERGQAVGIDESGRLQIAVGDRTLAVAAGDVIHLRPA